MSATIVSMKQWVVAVVALTACGEHPHLRVEVTHPPDVDVKTTTISVYESDLVSCEKVEFGDLSNDELAAAKVDEIAIAAGLPADDLTMSRVDPKVIVARGYDQGGLFVSAGCGEKGLVGDGDSLKIDSVLTASVSVNGIGLDDADPFGIIVTVTDPLVRSLKDRVVSWRVHGADGATPFVVANLTPGDDSDWVPTNPACTNDNGIVRVHPTPPGQIGGFATSVRTSWSTEPPRTFTTFTPVDDTGRLALTAVTGARHWCTSRVSGATRRMVCLESITSVITAVDYTVTGANGGATIAESGGGTRQNLTQAGGDAAIGVFSVDRSPTVRDAYAVTNKGRVIPLFNPSIGSDGLIKLGLQNATDLAVMPACGTTPQALLLNIEDKALRTLAIDPAKPIGQGQAVLGDFNVPIAGAETLGINRTGCLAELQSNGDPIIRQVAAIDIIGRLTGPRNTTAAFFECGGSALCAVPVAVARAGVGFLPADDLHPERMVGTTFDASGTVLSVGVLQPDKTGVARLVELERITAASFPAHVVTGNFDRDGRPDLFWDIPNINGGTSNFQLAYDHRVEGQRLSALSSTQQDVLVVDTFVADVTGDGLDDLVIASQDKVLAPTKQEVRVIPGQLPIKQFTPAVDPPCVAR